MPIPGTGKRIAEVVVAEVGVDMGRFPTAAHLASWAGLCPGNHQSAGKRRSGRARKGDSALRTALCEAAWAAAHAKDGYLPAQYRRFLRRFGKKNENKALFALAHTLIVIIWHVLAEGCDTPTWAGTTSTSATRRGPSAVPRARAPEAGPHRHAAPRGLTWPPSPFTSGLRPDPGAPTARGDRGVFTSGQRPLSS